MKIITESFLKSPSSHSHFTSTSTQIQAIPSLPSYSLCISAQPPKLPTTEYGLPYPGTHLHNQYLHDRKPAACPKMLRWRLWCPTVNEGKSNIKIIRLFFNYFLSFLNQAPSCLNFCYSLKPRLINTAAQTKYFAAI